MQRHLKLIDDLVKGKPVHLRSRQWDKFEKAHLIMEPACQWCGGSEKLHVHHLAPFHLAPALELEPVNFITLCEEGGLNCHLFHGHNGDWKSFNDRVREECDEHKRSPDEQLLRALRKQDADLYEWIIQARKVKGK